MAHASSVVCHIDGKAKSSVVAVVETKSESICGNMKTWPVQWLSSA